MTVKDENDPVNQMLDKMRPYAAKLTFGSIVGYCSGAAAKKIGRALAVLCGLGFIAIQSGELVLLSLYQSRIYTYGYCVPSNIWLCIVPCHTLIKHSALFLRDSFLLWLRCC
jgi:hypothetical protein